MKRITKQVFAFFLACVLTAAAVMAVPHPVMAASPKTASKSLAVTDTKISGFKEITGTLSLNGKYVVAYGKDSKGANVYSYSKNGKTFTKAKKVGMDGEIAYYAVGKNLYVLPLVEEYGAVDLDAGYKCVTDPAKLAKASGKKIKISVPKEIDYSLGYGIYMKFSVEKTGRLYLEGDILEGAGMGATEYSVVLNGTKATVTNVTNVVQKALKKVNTESIGVDRIEYCDASPDSLKAFCRIYYYDKDIDEEVFEVFYTTDGIKFKRYPMISHTGVKYNYGISYSVDWMGDTMVAYCSNGGYDYAYMQSDSKNRGFYYLYNMKSKKWEKKTLGKSYKDGFVMGPYGGPRVGYSSATENVLGVARYNYIEGNAVQVLYTTNGTKWKTIKKYTVDRSLGGIQSAEFINNGKGIYLEAVYGDSESKQYVLAKLQNNSWKNLKTIKIKEGQTYFSDGLTNPPYAIFSGSKKATGYNLDTGKSYTLPFNFNDNVYTSGNIQVYYSGKQLYGTKNGFKNISKITLKAGKKKLTKTITGEWSNTLQKTEYFYIAVGNKMYYTTCDKLQACV